MPWAKREMSSDLVILGDGERQTEKVSGLLANTYPDPKYPDNKRYELVQKDGSSKVVAGSAAINNQLGVGDVGSFVRLIFKGWDHSRRSKIIEVHVYEGEISGEMKGWPRWSEIQQRRAEHRDGDEPPGADPMSEPPEEDDDLPF